MTDSTLKMSLSDFQDLVNSPETIMAEGAYAFKVGRNQKYNPYPEGHQFNYLWQDGWDRALEQDIGTRDRKDILIRHIERSLDKC